MPNRNTPATTRRGVFHRRLRVELLESRRLLTGETVLINFQLVGTEEPTRYLPDTGEVYGDRGNGQFYGWSSDHTDVSRDRDVNSDQRLDTLIHFHQGQVWELALPNGLYEVTVSIGDAEHASTHTLNVEATSFWSATPLSPNEFSVDTQQVAVTDGRLTLDQGAAGEKATRIDYIHVVGLPNGPNSVPTTPTVTEPAVDGQEVNPSDVHLEAVGFSDPDGDLHLSSDWEIWTVGPGAERVWQTLGITGVELLHTHLGDGTFENSHAGRSDLIAETDFEVRVRYRDDAGSVSAYGLRSFHTGEASTIFPLEVVDILSTPTPNWLNSGGNAVIFLPAAPDQSELRLESASGDILLSMMGLDGVTNSVTNTPPLGDHADVRVVLVAGSGGLNLGETDITFDDDHGQSRTVFLPTVTLAAGERLDLWVASDGATYFGAAVQTDPDFSNLARQVDLPVPFIALQAGFEVDVVAGDLQLPVNIAFVPNPTSNPGDPLFYVTELYGTIKVVTNDFAVSDYATGLLNFDPTGNFPGSGEQGLTGIVVEPVTGDVIVTRVADTDGLPGGEHHPQVVRFTSNDGGLSAATETVLLDMVGESQGQSHQISNVSIGPDDKLYVHNGDGFTAATAQNLDSFRGKILRMNLDGSAPEDNPFYDAGNGINSRDYVYAYGLRNPFGGAWRVADGKHYEVENGPSIDRFAQVNEGTNYGWTGSNSDLLINALYNWDPAHAPVNITFVQPATFGGSQFPASKMDRAFVSESGPTYAAGPQTRGKRIVEFQLDAGGNVLDGPTTLVEYVGTGRATVVGLTAGPDGLYFTDLYKDIDAISPIEAGARVYRVRYTGGIDAITVDTLVDEADGNIVDGDVSLRDAIALAPSGATIDFAINGTISLTLGELLIERDVSIVGPGADMLTIDAGHGTDNIRSTFDGARIFNVDDGNDNHSIDVEIRALTLSGGDVFGDGGAILSSESLAVIGSTISNNSAGGNGGGIWALTDSGGVTLVAHSAITGNTAGEGGGGLFLITLTGGMTMSSNSTISGNAANGDGGGVWSYNASGDGLSLAHSTITANTADADATGAESGGGLFSTGAGHPKLANTIVAANVDGSTSQSDISGPVTATYSLVGDDTGATITDNGGNQIGTAGSPIDPLLGPLTDNGGFTFTHALLPVSPAIDAGDSGFVGPPDYDQRGTGYERVHRAAIDIGAYELLLADGNLDGVVDGLDYLMWASFYGDDPAQDPPGSPANGDYNGDGVVDGLDYLLWAVNYGVGVPAVSAAQPAETPSGSTSEQLNAVNTALEDDYDTGATVADDPAVREWQLSHAYNSLLKKGRRRRAGLE